MHKYVTLSEASHLHTEISHLIRTLTIACFRPLMLLWELVTHKKSHFYNWHPYVGSLDPKDLATGEGDKDARPCTGLLSCFWETNFGWEKIALLDVDTFESHRVGFVPRDGTEARLCDIIFDRTCMPGLLIGKQDFQFFAVDSHGAQVPVGVWKIINRQDLRSYGKQVVLL